MHIIVLTAAVLCTGIPAGCRPATPKVESATAITVAAAQHSNRPGCPVDKAVVSLTYDDGLSSQLLNALPALNEYQLKATFFLNDVFANPGPWKAAKAAGHELASHTLYHPCTAAFDWVKAGNASEDYDRQRMSDELDAQIRMLQSLGQQKPFSFAYPCGITWIGKAQTSYIPLIKERFIAARGTEGGIVTQLSTPMNVAAFFFEGPVESFIESINAAIQEKGWVVFGFHGIGGDYLTVSNDDHRALLKWLSEHSDEVAVLPFGEAALCMQEKVESRKR